MKKEKRLGNKMDVNSAANSKIDLNNKTNEAQVQYRSSFKSIK